MTTAFADASALVKRYAPEAGGSLLEGVSLLAVSSLSRVEVVSAIRRKQRLGELDASHANALCRDVEADFDATGQTGTDLSPISVSVDVLQRAAALLARHSLRAADAVQLSSAMFARDADAEVSVFVCFDARLRDAAVEEGFQLVPPLSLVS